MSCGHHSMPNGHRHGLQPQNKSLAVVFVWLVKSNDNDIISGNFRIGYRRTSVQPRWNPVVTIFNCLSRMQLHGTSFCWRFVKGSCWNANSTQDGHTKSVSFAGQILRLKSATWGIRAVGNAHDCRHNFSRHARNAPVGGLFSKGSAHAKKWM